MSIRIIRTAASLLILIYALQVFNNTFYLHTHVTEQGIVVSHAHPYNKADDSEPVKAHRHTMDQLLVLASFDFLFPVVFLVLLLIGFRDEKVFSLNVNRELRPACIILKKGRAPPAI